VTGVDTYIGAAVCKALAQSAGYNVTGCCIRAAPKGSQAVVPCTDGAACLRLASHAELIVLTLCETTASADDVLTYLQFYTTQAAHRERKLIVLSSMLTAGRHSCSKDNTVNTRSPCAVRGYLEHLRIEQTAVRLAELQGLQACVIQTGCVYGQGEGSAMFELHRDSWAGAVRANMPTIGDGINKPLTVHMDRLCKLLIEVVNRKEGFSQVTIQSIQHHYTSEA
jgi:nucleoside-diphosphate-sugar epimerase